MNCFSVFIHSFLTFTGTEVVVEYDYVAQEQDELNLKKGEVITNVVKIQEGWCQGLLNGRKGMFPDNFVKVFEGILLMK